MSSPRTTVVVVLRDSQIFVGFKKINRAARDFIKRDDDVDFIARYRLLDCRFFLDVGDLLAHVGDDGRAEKSGSSALGLLAQMRSGLTILSLTVTQQADV